MNINFPDPPANSLSPWLRTFIGGLKASLIPVVSIREAAPFLLINSPDGRTWKIAVANDGSLSVTALVGRIT